MPDADDTAKRSVTDARLAQTRDANPELAPDGPTVERNPTIPKPVHVPSEMRLASAAPDIPGYRDLQVIGRGGMGLVYRATQIQLNRTVAIKTILGPHAQDPRYAVRFLAEAQAVGTLDHPHVMRVYDSGQIGAMPYLVMEYLPGGTLADRLERRPGLPTREAVELMHQIALGVAAAHANQIVHRDLKPANVMFDAQGQPKVTDFGLAKKLGGSDLTATHAIMGTPAYMSPEQASGGSKFVGPEADVWALGVMLYECLTGQRPFQGTDALEVLRQVEQAEPSSVRSVNRSIPRDLELIVQKCLQREPAQRYATAKELAADLSCWLAGKPISVKAAGPVERLTKWVWRNQLATGIITASVLATATMTALAIWAIRESRRADELARRADAEADLAKEQAQRADAQARRAEEQEKRVRDEARESRRLLDLARLRTAQLEWDNRNVSLARDQLAAVLPENRCIVWGLLNRQFQGSQITLYGHSNRVTSVAVSPDGQRIITGSQDCTARVWDAASGQSLLILWGHSDEIKNVAVSPDGRWIVTGSRDCTVRLWDAVTGRCLRQLVEHSSMITGVAFSADGHRVITGSADGTVRVWDAVTGQSLQILKGHSEGPVAVAVTADGQRIISAGDQTARVWDAATGQRLLVLKGHLNDIASVAVSPDGSRIVTGSRDRTAQVWDAASGQSLLVLQGHLGEIITVLFSPDGRRIVTGSVDQTARVWDAVSGQCLLVLHGHSDTIQGLAVSPDGRWLITGSSDRTVRVWDMASGQKSLMIKAHLDEVKSVAVSLDGRRLATGSRDQTVCVWDATSGQRLLELQGHSLGISSVAFSPDGSRLATGSLDRTAQVWDAVSGQSLLVLQGHSLGVSSVAFSPDGRRLVTASYDKTAWVWDAITSQRLLELKGHEGAVWGAIFSPDGQRIITGSVDKTARVWDVASGQSLLKLQGHTSVVNSVAVSPDGSRIVTGSSDKTARVWDAASGQSLLELKGHTSLLTSVAFSPDGRRIVTSARDHTVRLWDAATGQNLLVLKGHSGKVWSVAFSPDGRSLITGGGEFQKFGEVRVWDADLAEPEVYGFPTSDEIAHRRRLLRPDPMYHLAQAQQAERENNRFAAAVHRALEQRARGHLALAVGDFDRAWGHFLAAALLRPPVKPKP
jgi:WD40 repeat protein